MEETPDPRDEAFTYRVEEPPNLVVNGLCRIPALDLFRRIVFEGRAVAVWKVPRLGGAIGLIAKYPGDEG